jgi:hypothetical protein
MSPAGLAIRRESSEHVRPAAIRHQAEVNLACSARPFVIPACRRAQPAGLGNIPTTCVSPRRNSRTPCWGATRTNRCRHGLAEHNTMAFGRFAMAWHLPPICWLAPTIAGAASNPSNAGKKNSGRGDARCMLREFPRLCGVPGAGLGAAPDSLFALFPHAEFQFPSGVRFGALAPEFQ